MTCSIDGGRLPFEMTASLHQAHAPWLTEVFIDLQIDGLTDDWSPTQCHASVPAHEIGTIGQLLVGLADRAAAAQRRAVAERLADRCGEACR